MPESGALDIRIGGAEALGHLSKQLYAVAGKEMSKQLRLAVKDVTRPLVDEIKANVEPVSKTVARSITAEARLTGKTPSVTIKAKRSKMPPGHEGFPAALENGGRPGTFRHRVFGHGKWVTQKAHPFMAPAVAHQQEAIFDRFVKAVEAVARNAGVTI